MAAFAAQEANEAHYRGAFHLAAHRKQGQENGEKEAGKAVLELKNAGL
jgi:hypothetical protein